MLGDLELAFRLPLPGWPRAVFATDYGLRGGRLVVEGGGGACGVAVLEADSRAALETGVAGALADGRPVRAAVRDGELELWVAGARAIREDRLRAPLARAALGHAAIAAAGSLAGFVASWLYLVEAAANESAWSLAMGRHMAGWHLLLTVTLVPASLWGQRAGIRVVQMVSAVFFAIHAGIALANLGAPETAYDGWIAALNAASGLAFLVAVPYGQRAHRDMDPLRGLPAVTPADSPAAARTDSPAAARTDRLSRTATARRSA